MQYSINSLTNKLDPTYWELRQDASELFGVNAFDLNLDELIDLINEPELNQDDATKAKRIIDWNGYKIGLQYLPFEKRHGRTLSAAYGYFQNTKGEDSMALDCYVGTDLDSNKIFVVEQLVNGVFDEYKFIIGVDTLEKAKAIYLAAMPPEFMGSIKECTLDELKSFNLDSKNREDKSTPKNPELWKRVLVEAKSKFDVYPSLYANQWASKRYKELGGEWRSDAPVVNETQWVELRLDGSLSDVIEPDAMMPDRRYVALERTWGLSEDQLKELAKIEYKKDPEGS